MKILAIIIGIIALTCCFLAIQQPRGFDESVHLIMQDVQND